MQRKPTATTTTATPGSRCSSSLGRACTATASSHPLAHPAPSWQQASPQLPPWTQHEIGRIAPAAAAAATSQPSVPRTHRCCRAWESWKQLSVVRPAHTRTRRVWFCCRNCHDPETAGAAGCCLRTQSPPTCSADPRIPTQTSHTQQLQRQ